MKIRNNFLKLICIYLLAGVMLASASCAKQTKINENTPEAETQETAVVDGKISVTDTKVEYISDDKEKSFEVDLNGSVSLPDGYPKEVVPLYPGAKLSLASKDGENYSIILKTDDSIDKAYAYYEENCKLDNVGSVHSTDGAGTIMGTSNGLNVSILIMENTIDSDGKNIITISLGK